MFHSQSLDQELLVVYIIFISCLENISGKILIISFLLSNYIYLRSEMWSVVCHYIRKQVHTYMDTVGL